MKINTTWIQYALSKGKVRNIGNGKVGHLQSWGPRQYCGVFVGYQYVGAAKLPLFETWTKDVVVRETRDFAAGQIAPPQDLSWASI